MDQKITPLRQPATNYLFSRDIRAAMLEAAALLEEEAEILRQSYVTPMGRWTDPVLERRAQRMVALAVDFRGMANRRQRS